MLVKALTGFAGKVSMYEGEIKEIADEIADDLLKAGHVEEVKSKVEEKKAAKKTTKKK